MRKKLNAYNYKQKLKPILTVVHYVPLSFLPQQEKLFWNKET